MKNSDIKIAEKLQNLVKRLIVDYGNGIIKVEDKNAFEEISSILNEKITILTNLRNYTLPYKENCTLIPACKEEIRAVVDKFSH
ncbi:MAG: hypothetical protein E7509_01205 [Ruminococcus sp.]|nr:hypothetical protein [Ruminococcus sp.]